MQVDVQNQVVLVTGSARRVGKAIALAFAQEKARLVIHHHASDAEAQATLAEVQALGCEAIIVKGDLSQHEEVARCFDEVMAHYGRIDSLVNSASIFNATPFLEVSPE